MFLEGMNTCLQSSKESLLSRPLYASRRRVLDVVGGRKGEVPWKKIRKKPWFPSS